MERLWKSDLGNGTFQNPVLFADYSDPDVIRVGDTFYMTASSFNYIPGLPILISKDLVNWKLVNYALDRIDYKNYDIPQHSKGVWAPAIRYHDGEFYIYYGMPDEGFFMVKTKDPLGKWEKPVLVLEGKGLIDSCPFWDDDGKAYLIHGYAKSRIGFKSYLGIFPMSYDGTTAIGEDHILYNGVETQPTIEGPKVYKRNGYYYIFAPAGGVKTGWQTVLRSKNIYGPYEEKIVMHQGNSVINGPHQGGLVDTINGDEWFLHFQDRGLYGRIVHMQPVYWKNDWPVIGINENEEGCGEPCMIHNKPNTGIVEEACYLEASDEFDKTKLGLQWQWLGNEQEGFYSLLKKIDAGETAASQQAASSDAMAKGIRLFCLNPSGKKNPILWENANVLTQKIVCPYFKAVTKCDVSALSEKEQAGLVMMGGYYAYVGVRVQKGEKLLVYAESMEKDGTMCEEVKELAVLDNTQEMIWLSLRMEEGISGPEFFMAYSLDGENFADVETDFMPSDHTWVGAKIGLFANVLEENRKGGYADFSYIHVDAL